MVGVRSAPGIALVVVLTLGAAASAQQQGAIRGTLYDKDFEKPLPGAKVAIVETGQKTTTSDQGNYVFNQVKPGKYTVVFSKQGYVRVVRSDIVVTAGKLTELNVALAGDFTDMDEFIVQDILRLGTGSEAELLKLRLESPSFENSIAADTMSRAGASDAAAGMRLVPGATVKEGKSAVIRGLPDRYVSSQMNGVRLPTADEDKRAVELDQFPTAVIESLRVTKTFTPDQQGDASGGAVDVRLRGVPDQNYIQFKSEYKYNSQVRNRDDFLSYYGGGVRYWGNKPGRKEQLDKLGMSWDGAVGVDVGDAPDQYKWSVAGGWSHELEPGVKVGGFVTLFHENDTAYDNDAQDNSWWIESPGAPMTPKKFQNAAADDFKTGFYDVTYGVESVQWGGLATLGLETEHNSLGIAYLYSRTTEDRATLAEDTRGKQYFFPGYDPNDPTTPGHAEPDAAPYLRLETLNYTERTTQTLQLHGSHTLPFEDDGLFKALELDWTVARSSADLNQPDKRQFGTQWVPERTVGPFTFPPTHSGYKPAANFTLGNLQRIWKEINEDSQSYAMDLKLPFEQWSGEEGYLKTGVYYDSVQRKFDQDTFSNFGDNSSYDGEWNDLWSARFPNENHPITDGPPFTDVDYDGSQRIAAHYYMLDLPLTSQLKVIGGVRFEKTNINIINYPEADATWFPPGALAPTKLNPGDADVFFRQDDALPSVAFIYEPYDELTLRASYSQTVARQTFKELTPILQQEFLGGPIFIGNPSLKMSDIENYDLRADYAPYEGALVSVSWFMKHIQDPIEYVQVIGTFDYTTAKNYPRGKINGYEFEVRQQLGHFWESLQGLTVGANATLIDSEVKIPADEQQGFNKPNIMMPMTHRDMTDTPEYLYNLYLLYDLPSTGTQFSVFYTLEGDALIAGAAESVGNFVPNVYQEEFDTLNLNVSQRIGDYLKLTFQVKNLTNPDYKTVYRTGPSSSDVTRTRTSKGIDYTIAIGGEIKF